MLVAKATPVSQATLDKRPHAAPQGAAGILVLGMHRSGTSALSRVLQLGGADIGTRLIGASSGNDAGHWEDAFAVETNERLLGLLGRRWDDLNPLPANWRDSEGVEEVAQAVRKYVVEDRAQHGLWAVKDPRLSLVGSVWRDAAKVSNLPLGAVLVIRHPLEVAHSLAARDGMPLGHALMLWLNHNIEALRVASGIQCVVMDYDHLLKDWRRCTESLRTLPGGDLLAWEGDSAIQVDAYLDAGRRHHRADAGSTVLPQLVADAWTALSACARNGENPAGLVDRLSRKVEPVFELLRQVLGEWSVKEHALWTRVQRAEHLAVNGAVPLRDDLRQLQALVTEHHSAVVQAASADIRKMQDTVAQTVERAAASEAKAVLAEQLSSRVEQLKVGVSGLHQAVELFPRSVDSLRSSIDQHHADVIEALSSDVRRMQDVVVQARERSAAFEAKAEVAGHLAARVDELRAGHLGLARSLDLLPLSLEALRVTVDRHHQGVIGALSDDVRRMQDVVAATLERAARSEERAASLEASMEHLGNVSAASQVYATELVSQLKLMTTQLEHAADRIVILEKNAAELSARSHSDAARLAMLEPDAAFVARVRASRLWRYRKPFRFLYRVLSGRQTRSHTRRDLLSALAAGVRALPLPLSIKQRVTHSALQVPGQVSLPLLPTMEDARQLKISPAPALHNKPDVFVWAVIDWHFRTQRPQHLARAMARAGHRVFYVSNNFVDATEPGFSMEPLDKTGHIYQIHLNLTGAPAIYFGLPSDAEMGQLRGSFASLLAWTGTAASVSMVQHPYWTNLSALAPNTRRVYDCMDHHAGFENTASALGAAENRLLQDSDLVVVTSDWLEREVSTVARNVAMVRNACEYDFFCERPEKYFRDERGRQVIGYYGAIAEWFDAELVGKVAEAFPQCLVVLVGNDTAEVAAAMEKHRNVRMIGEVAYSELPYWLHGFDVCLLPFKVIPLTLATNPVKIYEYLSAGKPVVSVDLPEMAQFGDLISTSSEHAGFVSAVGAMLAATDDADASGRRQAYAAEQTWSHRATALDDALAAIVEPLVSVIVLTYNNQAYTEACLFSIEHYSDYPNLEIIVVDNDSTDGSREFLAGWVNEASAAGHRRQVILNESNLGFAAGNNVGLAAASGQYLVMVNNDTYATPGWVRSLVAHLRRDSDVGLVGPVTNNIGNEARIDIHYANMVDMIRLSGDYTRQHPGGAFPISTVAFFCVGMPRAVYERVGGLDEAFGVGFFEDDDYCRRVEAAGWRIVCAEDVFVHHHLSASFDQLGSGRKQELFQQNRLIYEQKWGPWKPHGYREAGG